MPTRYEAALYAVALGWVFVTPYIKVEESFTLHAVRDWLVHGYDQPQLFDHVEFPGAVPRSFIPPAMLSMLVLPLVSAGAQLELLTSHLHVQTLIRAVLAIINVTSLVVLLRSARTTFGLKIVRTATLLILTQFHVLYYASRTLPNMMAFPFVQLAFAYLLENGPKAYERAICIIGATALVARLELLALAAPLALNGIRRGATSIQKLVVPVSLFSGAAIASSIAVDSKMWRQERLWPEGQSFWFNVVEGQSSSWGVSPWFSYFALSLTRLMFPAWPFFALMAIFIDRRARLIGIPALEFVVALSILKHKEWRFIVYILPVLNLCTAAGIESLQAMFSRRLKQNVLHLVLALAALSTVISGFASYQNYPGGVALSRVAQMPLEQPSIHFDSYVAMNGASLFLHEHTNAWYLSRVNGTQEWTWDKSEGRTARELAYYDVIVTEDATPYERSHEIVESVQGFDGIDWKNARVRLADKVFILRRR